MARANRHYIPGQIWHITHRCHNRDALLRCKQDRKQWLSLLYKARNRYKLQVLNYAVMTNHIHLLVLDSIPGAIPKSMQLIAGKTAQYYNFRHQRKGAFWEDRYHATAVAGTKHLLKCMVYIDMNPVRAGLVAHPSEWYFSAYNESRQTGKRYTIIARRHLMALMGFASWQELCAANRNWIASNLLLGNHKREPFWTEAIAVGSLQEVFDIMEQLKPHSERRNLSLIQNGADWVLK
jgi:putative transposase